MAHLIKNLSTAPKEVIKSVKALQKDYKVQLFTTQDGKYIIQTPGMHGFREIYTPVRAGEDNLKTGKFTVTRKCNGQD